MSFFNFESARGAKYREYGISWCEKCYDVFEMTVFNLFTSSQTDRKLWGILSQSQFFEFSLLLEIQVSFSPFFLFFTFVLFHFIAFSVLLYFSHVADVKIRCATGSQRPEGNKLTLYKRKHVDVYFGVREAPTYSKGQRQQRRRRRRRRQQQHQ